MTTYETLRRSLPWRQDGSSMHPTRTTVDSRKVTADFLSSRDRWLVALKLTRWPTWLTSAGLGQAIGVAVDGRVSWMGLVLGTVFVVLFAACVALLNDWCDQSIDGLQRRLFPEATVARPIPDRMLEPLSVLYAGVGCGFAAIGFAVIAELALDRPGLVVGALVALALFGAYSFPPIRLNYRGGGEVLVMVGIGFGLPWWQAYCQSGAAKPGGLVLLPAFALLALAEAIGSGLAHESSDRLGGKTTFVTEYGGLAVRQAIDGLVLGAMITWAILPRLAPEYATMSMVLPSVGVMAWSYSRLLAARSAPDVETQHGVADYLQRTRSCILRGGILMAVMVAVVGVLRGGIGGA